MTIGYTNPSRLGLNTLIGRRSITTHSEKMSDHDNQKAEIELLADSES